MSNIREMVAPEFDIDQMPVFADPLFTKDQYEDAAASNRTTFPRPLRVYAPSSVTNLAELLTIAERHFNAITEVGLGVVPHTWGLVEIATIPERYRTDFVTRDQRLLPTGYFLGAELVVVKKEELKRSSDSDFVRLISAYCKSPAVQAGSRLIDITPSDFEYGRLAVQGEGIERETRYWYHDLEPVFWCCGVKRGVSS